MRYKSEEKLLGEAVDAENADEAYFAYFAGIHQCKRGSTLTIGFK